jgi:hypothetical protein
VSLRAFHLLFIALSVVLSAFVAAWAFGQYRATPDAGYLAAATAGILSAAVLAVYGTAFRKKTRGL